MGCFLGLLSSISLGEVYSEAALRVTIVYKFVKFIEWPQDEADPTLRLCALGATGEAREALTSLDKAPVSTQVVDSKHVTTKAIDLVFLDDPAQTLELLKTCKMIYRPAHGLPIALPTPLPVGVLLVADDPGAHEANVSIALMRSPDRRIEFAISLSAAKQAGVTLSSQLLKLAKYRRGEQ